MVKERVRRKKERATRWCNALLLLHTASNVPEAGVNSCVTHRQRIDDFLKQVGAPRLGVELTVWGRESLIIALRFSSHLSFRHNCSVWCIHNSFCTAARTAGYAVLLVPRHTCRCKHLKGAAPRDELCVQRDVLLAAPAAVEAPLQELGAVAAHRSVTRVTPHGGLAGLGAEPGQGLRARAEVSASQRQRPAQSRARCAAGLSRSLRCTAEVWRCYFQRACGASCGGGAARCGTVNHAATAGRLGARNARPCRRPYAGATRCSGQRMSIGAATTPVRHS